MNKLLQKLFENECKRYEVYLRAYESIEAKVAYVSEILNTLENQKMLAEKMISLLELVESNQFQEELEVMTLPYLENLNVIFYDGKIREHSYEKYCKYQEENERKMQEHENEKRNLDSLIKVIREGLKESQTKLFQMIDIASEEKLKFSFLKNNKTAVEIFILYYQDDFEFENNRNIIEIEGCKLSESFMEAYKANSIEDELNAQKWFKEEAKKLKTF